MLKYPLDMNDPFDPAQGIPAQQPLTYEEELRVLEAVRKIGEEKGLDLLTAEQKKKLSEQPSLTHAISDVLPKEKTSKSVNFIVDYLVARATNDYKAEMNIVNLDEVSDFDKKGIIDSFFAYKYEITPEQLRRSLTDSLGTGL